jgi:hypothetical protein
MVLKLILEVTTLLYEYVSTKGPKFLNWKHNLKLYYARQWIKRGRDIETLYRITT